MLIFGFKVTDKLIATVTAACERCGNHAAHHVSKRARRFTLFFVPVIPVGTKYQDTCTACGRVLEVSKQQAQSALRG